MYDSLTDDVAEVGWPVAVPVHNVAGRPFVLLLGDRPIGLRDGTVQRLSMVFPGGSAEDGKRRANRCLEWSDGRI